MFAIKYETWQDICNMYFHQKPGRLRAYLQWYSFSKLTKEDKNLIASKEFFERYIQSGAAVLYDAFMLKTDNYMQKGDGSFRDSSLISPMQYLLIQAISKTIAEKYLEQRQADISVYYSGNIKDMRGFYKEDYDTFYKEVNSEAQYYSGFIKTDIHDFYRNINLNKLFQRVENNINANGVQITQYQIQLFKGLLEYCGSGRYPVIENSVGLSFLATVIYLEEIDIKLYDFIESYMMKSWQKFKMIRYVDDLYIMFKSETPAEISNGDYNEVTNEYSSILKDYNLALNSSKSCIKPITEISSELKKSLYDEAVNECKFEMSELCACSIEDFLRRIDKNLLFDCLRVDQYNEIVEETFKVEGIEFTPSEVFNYFIYEKPECLREKNIEKLLIQILRKDISFISLDPKRLTVMIMQTASGDVIKAFLNQLFKRNREGTWNSYDTVIAINYLIQRKFEHHDMLNIIKNRCVKLYKYYDIFCKNSWGSIFDEPYLNKIVDITRGDKKTSYLCIMHLFEKEKNNTLGEYAYYKNFFDRLTAQIAFEIKYDNSKKPNYKLFYKEGEFKKFYSDITNSEKIIEKAHEIRNQNPITHASAKMLEKDSSNQEIIETIEDLKNLIYEFCKIKKLC